MATTHPDRPQTAGIQSDGEALTVSVVVCAYSTDRRPLLDRCLKSVVGQLRPGDELIVVIDHNDALLQAFADQWVGPEPLVGPVSVIANRLSRGLSGARNTGAAAAGGDIVAFVDDDASVECGWLERARRHYADTAVAAVGGYAQPIWPQSRPEWFPEEFDWVVGCSHRGLPTVTTAVRNVIGCNMSFRRSALADVGGFHTGLGRVGTQPDGGEETELCIRIQQQVTGAQIVFDPELVVRHTVSADRINPRYFLHRCLAEGRSKSQISSMVGREAALRTERSYVAKVLPAAILRGVGGAITGPRRRAHLARSALIALGLAVTAAGYLSASVQTSLRHRR